MKNMVDPLEVNIEYTKNLTFNYILYFKNMIQPQGLIIYNKNIPND